MTRDAASADLFEGANPPTPDVALRPAFVVNPNGYAIIDFTHFQREGFVRAAFVGLLRREPDRSGLDHFVTRLEGGDSKVLILGLVRYSPEGRRHAIPVRGLFWRFALERAAGVPIFGPVVRLFVDFVRLPSLAREARQSEARLERVATQQVAEMARVTTALAATDSLGRQARENEARLLAMTDALGDTAGERSAARAYGGRSGRRGDAGRGCARRYRVASDTSAGRSAARAYGGRSGRRGDAGRGCARRYRVASDTGAGERSVARAHRGRAGRRGDARRGCARRYRFALVTGAGERSADRARHGGAGE